MRRRRAHFFAPVKGKPDRHVCTHCGTSRRTLWPLFIGTPEQGIRFLGGSVQLYRAAGEKAWSSDRAPCTGAS